MWFFPPPLIFRHPWYYYWAVGLVSFVPGKFLWDRAPEREIEAEQRRLREQKEERAEREKRANWEKWFRAFQKGTISEYTPVLDASKYGGLMIPGEVCYLATKAVLGRGNVHQLEMSSHSSSGLDIKGVKLEQAGGKKDTYSSIRYDEEHPGNLLVTNKRVTFVSVPAVFLDIEPPNILSVAFWENEYVMVRTNLTSDDSKNLLAFRITGEQPAWLFASAVFRLRVGDSAPAPESLITPPTSA